MCRWRGVAAQVLLIKVNQLTLFERITVLSFYTPAAEPRANTACALLMTGRMCTHIKPSPRFYSSACDCTERRQRLSALLEPHKTWDLTNMYARRY